ncbi:hypothetical protein NEOLEDRAFT_1076288 [Neolentinus lepideus HHB14362 ss-1]|uniref:Uncharacterized protein n=1 Tax=Neolentinus lepideus HHB14362 ss-1 TaxID=1314782 RepID=A0A165NUK7_9AGAM|nr:hypothetical protein NEOLEDRAFT_1076288 [Neolentinus lepideus HHB14362 ss-1]
MSSTQFYFKHNHIYRHATAAFNFTRYNIRRDRNTVNPTTDKCNILVAREQSAEGGHRHPFGYARVLGVYHVQIQGDFVLDGVEAAQFNFLWVRWYKYADEIPAGTAVHHLECLQFILRTDSNAFGFLDPAHVI